MEGVVIAHQFGATCVPTQGRLVWPKKQGINEPAPALALTGIAACSDLGPNNNVVPGLSGSHTLENFWLRPNDDRPNDYLHGQLPS
jgi:hypothetical protein